MLGFTGAAASQEIGKIQRHSGKDSGESRQEMDIRLCRTIVTAIWPSAGG